MAYEDLIPVLTKFHREVVVPDIERIVGTVTEGLERRLRDEMHTLFDSLAHEIQELRTEYHMIVAGMKRIEERLDRVEQQLQKLALRSELLDLKARVDGLQEQVRVLESQLGD